MEDSTSRSAFDVGLEIARTRIAGATWQHVLLYGRYQGKAVQLAAKCKLLLVVKWLYKRCFPRKRLGKHRGSTAQSGKTEDRRRCLTPARSRTRVPARILACFDPYWPVLKSEVACCHSNLVRFTRRND